MEQTKKNVENAQVTLLLEIDGEIHLVGMSPDRRDALSMMVKASAEIAVPTKRSQAELNAFLQEKIM